MLDTILGGEKTMKNIVIDFNEKMPDELTSENYEDALSGELQFLILDCCEIKRALSVYKQLTCEEYFANTVLFNKYYQIITDALVVQIVISLSRIFDNHKDAVPLIKTLNRLQQTKLFKNDVKIKEAIKELIGIDSDAKKNFDFKGPRDQCFAHLDKKQIFSRTRIIKCIGNKDDLINLIDIIISKLTVLHKFCFGKSALVYDDNIEFPDLRNLVDFKERAEKAIANNSLYKNHLELTDSGMKYYPLGINK